MKWDFQIVQITAAGTFGHVCVAFDWTTRSFYALKVLKERFKHNRKVLARTRDEAAMLAAMNHPNILRVHEMLEVEDRPVVVMEWVQGCSLQDLVDCTPEGIEGPIALELTRLAAKGLHAAWTTVAPGTGQPLRVIHRDVKPSNLLISIAGELKVVDFGIARGTFEGKQAETVSMVLGARAYMAPERLDGAGDTPRLDVYALGLVLIEMWRGERVKLSLRPNVHDRQVADTLDQLTLRGLTPEAEAQARELVLAMTAYEPERRPDAAQVARRIRDILGRRPNLPRFANRQVRPIFEANSLVDPRTLPEYREVAFLDALGPTRPGGARDIDARLRAFLATADWANRVEELWTLLLLNPAWTARPFLEWLAHRRPQWWQFWAPHYTATIPQKIALLRIFASRFDDEVRVQVIRLRGDPNPQVRKLATALLTAETHAGQG